MASSDRVESDKIDVVRPRPTVARLLVPPWVTGNVLTRSRSVAVPIVPSDLLVQYDDKRVYLSMGPASGVPFFVDIMRVPLVNEGIRHDGVGKPLEFFLWQHGELCKLGWGSTTAGAGCVVNVLEILWMGA